MRFNSCLDREPMICESTLRRRDFLGAALAFTSADQVIQEAGARLRVDSTGSIQSLRCEGQELIPAGSNPAHPSVWITGGEEKFCSRPTASHRRDGRLVFEYGFQGPVPFTVRQEITLLRLSSGPVVRIRIGVTFDRQPSGIVLLRIPLRAQLPAAQRRVFVPLVNGIGRKKEIADLDNDDEYVFRMAGSFRGGKPQTLAVPVLDEFSSASRLHLTWCADPFITSHLRLACGGRPGVFHCILPRTVPGREIERVLYLGLHQGDFNTAMGVFYETALAQVRPGPEWLHGVSMVDYDYLSKNGDGWFVDIDVLTQAVAPADREKIVLALHGWYDCVGRYSFDHRRGSLAKEWTTFPSAGGGWRRGPGGDPVDWNDAGVARLRPYRMSLGDMHRRIRYAKDRGFRVCLYYADGLVSCDGNLGVHDPSKVLQWGGWSGPDTIGKTYVQNPLHPEVREFFKRYMQALVEEYGREVDGFIWDETGYVAAGQTGTEAAPGCADIAMLRLVGEIADIVAGYNPRLALFTSDNIGYKGSARQAPYSLMAQGTFQDSHCRPEAWSSGLFPNFRNTLWSCNWAPVSNFRYTKYGVETFDAPVSISNGCFGDDAGISDMSPAQRKQVLDLFDTRKRRPMRIGWVEEHAGALSYQGRPLAYRYSL
jgi:hypothetical protein